MAESSSFFQRNVLSRNAVIGVPYLWLLVFFVVPFAIVLKISFAWLQPMQPGYTPLFEWVGEAQRLVLNLNLDNYQTVWQNSLYLSTLLYSLKVAAVSTLGCLLLGYPMAYAIARAAPSIRGLLLMLIILPFWTSFLLRVYAWVGLLKTNGLINNTLLGMGLIDQPLTLLYTDFAVYVGMIYSYLPFMILPLYANLEKHDLTLLESAADLGARPMTAFLRVTLPLSMPGVIAGCLLVFIPAVGEYVIPSLLGRTDQLMIGTVLSAQFFGARNWPVASAVAIVLLIVLLIPILVFQRYQRRELEAAAR